MRIMLGCDTFRPHVNGSSRFVQRLATGLVSRGHEVHVLHPSTRTRRTDTEWKGIRLHGVASVAIPGHAPVRFSPFGYRLIDECIERFPPDVMHVQSHLLIGRAALRRAKRAGVPTVATNHFMPDNLVVHVSLRPWLSEWLAHRAWKDAVAVLTGADVVTAPTRTAVQMLRERGMTGPIRTVSCGVDLDEFNGDHPADGDRRHAPVPTCLYVGRLEPEKNVDCLIRAFARMRYDVGARLVIVGTGSCAGPLKRQAEAEAITDDVEFLGYVPDPELARLYAACDVFCNPGTAELQSLVMLEAMASGLPVVAADRARLGAASRAIARRHDIALTIATFENLYERLAAR